MYSVALFDIDGTLCDPGDGISAAAQHALAQFGIAEDDEAALRRFVGPPLEHSFADVYGLGPAEVLAAVAHYREHYRGSGLGRYRAYPGIEEVLQRLAAAGVRLGVVTAKMQEFAEQALRNTGLLPYFATVSGPAPQEVVTKDVTLGKALDLVGAPLVDVVMIGDREHDIHAARAHGIDSIGVQYGYGTRAELSAAGATHLAPTPASVASILLRPSAGDDQRGGSPRSAPER
jgi:phosphoglycolate phosphatase